MIEPIDTSPDLMTPIAEQLCADALDVTTWPLTQRQSPNGYHNSFPTPPLSGLYIRLTQATTIEARQSAIDGWLVGTGHSDVQVRKIHKRIANRTPGAHQSATSQDKYGFESQSGTDLMGEDLPPLKHIVEQFIYEGSTILAGSPKTGKSYMMLGMALAIAFGGKALGKFDCVQGEVLFFALEDGKRRVQRRLTKMLQGGAMPAGLHFVYRAPKLGEGFIEGLNAYLDDHPRIVLVVVDTMAKVRPQANSKATPYQQDYETVDPFTQLSHDRNIGVVLVTHTGKMERDDPMAMVSGTQGLTGAADAAIIVTRERGTPELHCTVMGRDFDEETEHILRWDAQIAGLAHQGNAADMARNKERIEVLTAIEEVGGAGSIQDIATAVGKSYQTMKTMLWRMAQDGVIEKDRQNKYKKCRNPVTSVTSSLVVDHKRVTFGDEGYENGLHGGAGGVTPKRPVTGSSGGNVTKINRQVPEENEPDVTDGYEVSPDPEEDYPLDDPDYPEGRF